MDVIWIKLAKITFIEVLENLKKTLDLKGDEGICGLNQ